MRSKAWRAGGACVQPEGMMEQKVEYLSTLEAAIGLRLTGGKLQIFSAEGILLAFSPA